MPWTIDFSSKAEKQFSKIDKIWQKKITDYLRKKVKSDPLSFGKPANAIKNDLSEILKSKYNLKVINGAKDAMLESRKVDSMLSNYRDGNLVLDVYSTITGQYYPFRFSRYKVLYNGFVRLIDRETESVIFKSTCTYDKKENNDNSLEEISKNPKVISAIFKNAQQFCLEKFTKEILK